jgi:transketolase
VMRPGDTLETAECWEIALKETTRPTVLALTRQNLPAVRHDAGENLCARGGYRLQAATAARQVVLIATGSEVELALNVAQALEGQGIGADVVSMPCTQLFDEQPDSYRADILSTDGLRVSIEAGTTFGWERYTGLDGLRIGLDHFGASAPAEVLFEEFGFSVDAIVPKILAKLGK